ncbi:MAG TPA: hypothetical protein VFA04_09070 [Bryobacteraceae bacterium]|nr:hypothetical protein [Bryobacteraceae bacterium]
MSGIDHLLPRESELVVLDSDGNESRSLSRFSSCRAFSSHSFLRMDDDQTSALAQLPGAILQLPAGASLELELTSPVSFDESAVGDPVTAGLVRAVRFAELTIPKGAVALGHIVRLEQYFEPRKYFVVSLDFSSLAFGEKSAVFRARLIGPRLQAGSAAVSSGTVELDGSRNLGMSSHRPSTSEMDVRGSFDIVDEAGPGAFRVWGTKLRLPPGLRMDLKTQQH